MKDKKNHEKRPTQQAGRSYFALSWGVQGGETKVPSYIVEVLVSGCCRSYLPMRFNETTEGLIAYYEDTGFIPLVKYYEEQMEIERTPLRLAAWLLRKLAEGQEEAEDFLLLGEETRITLDCVFVSVKSGKVALAYLPQGEGMVFSKRLLALLQELAHHDPESELPVLYRKLEREVEENTPGTGGLLRLFSQWERELN